jgi:hypothetical protein
MCLCVTCVEGGGVSDDSLFIIIMFIYVYIYTSFFFAFMHAERAHLYFYYYYLLCSNCVSVFTAEGKRRGKYTKIHNNNKTIKIKIKTAPPSPLKTENWLVLGFIS